MKDGAILELDGLPLRLSVNRRARRVSIRIDAVRGQAVVVAPSERRLVDAVAFARSRQGWIAERLTARPAGSGYAPGSTVPLEGIDIRLEQTPGGAAARLVDTPDGPAIRSGGQGDAYARRIENLLKRMARERLAHHTGVHARSLGLKEPKVGIGDPRSRWGSCTPGRGSIRYSWRLILAPPEILDYVAAHEVAHLVHADHSPAFWGVVERLIGDHKPYRAWLRANGAGLHAVGRG